MTSSSRLPRRGGAWLRVMHRMIRRFGIDIVRYPAPTRFAGADAAAAALEISCVLDVGAIAISGLQLAVYPVARKLDGLQVIEFDCTMMRADRS